MKKFISLFFILVSMNSFANIVEADESSLDQDLGYSLEESDESQRDVASDENSGEEQNENNLKEDDSYNSLKYWKY